MNTGVHDIISARDIPNPGSRRDEKPWAAGFYVAVALTVLLLLIRGLWPPEDRLTAEPHDVTQVR
jgi:hypothetical protein